MEQVCKFFASGQCRFGRECRFVHPGSETSGFGNNAFGNPRQAGAITCRNLSLAVCLPRVDVKWRVVWSWANVRGGVFFACSQVSALVELRQSSVKGRSLPSDQLSLYFATNQLGGP